MKSAEKWQTKQNKFSFFLYLRIALIFMSSTHTFAVEKTTHFSPFLDSWDFQKKNEMKKEMFFFNVSDFNREKKNHTIFTSQENPFIFFFLLNIMNIFKLPNHYGLFGLIFEWKKGHISSFYLGFSWLFLPKNKKNFITNFAEKKFQ